jgi:hypothetical protein
MSTVRTDVLKVGLTLAKDVKNAQGQLLIRSGVEIIERHLVLLKSWGITEVEVQEEIGRPSEANSNLTDADPEGAARLQAARNGLLEMFRHNNLEEPVMAELIDLCAHRRLKVSR